LLAGWRHQRIGLAAAAILVAGGLIVATRTQVRYWRDGETLFRHAIKASTHNAVAQYCLGDALSKQGRKNEALACFREALNLHPANPEAHNYLGGALFRDGKTTEAADHFSAAVRAAPTFIEAQNNLGIVLVA